jgi:colanic acid/amylovoran biosynthesis glycosyltransferase
LKRSIVFLNSVFPCLSETFVYDQFQALSSAGLEFDIVSNHKPQATEVHPRMRDIQSKVHYLCAAGLAEMLAAHGRMLFKRPWRYLVALLTAPWLDERLKVSLSQMTGAAILLRRFAHRPHLHLHAHFTYGAAGVALWAQRLDAVPYSLTLHGSDLIFDNPPDLEMKLSSADALVSISRFNIDFLQTHFPQVKPKHQAIIPMGIPPLEGVQPPMGRGEVLRMLTVGRLSNHKAQHVLIDACAILQARGVVFQCDIVGEGDKREFLETRIRENRLETSVRLLGPRFHQQVLEMYRDTDLFVLCSITEGQPVVLMEAMRAGVPLVTTAIAAIPELVQDAGILVPPSDPQALADAIEKFAHGEVAWQAMTVRAQAIIAESYDLEKNSLRFKAFLETLPV